MTWWILKHLLFLGRFTKSGVERVQSYLQIKQVQSKDQGFYRCRVDFFQAPTRNVKVKLSLIGKKNIIVNLRNMCSIHWTNWNQKLKLKIKFCCCWYFHFVIHFEKRGLKNFLLLFFSPYSKCIKKSWIFIYTNKMYFGF